MKEVEVKILEVGHKVLEERLFAFGCTKIDTVEIKDEYFADENDNLSNSSKILRIRCYGDKSFLTHKSKVNSAGFKIRDEVEIEVSDANDTKKIFESLGYRVYFTVMKQRVSYKLDDIKFEFDKMLGEHNFVPEFLELESENEDTIKKYVELLGFDMSDTKTWGGKKVIKYYKKLKLRN